MRLAWKRLPIIIAVVPILVPLCSLAEPTVRTIELWRQNTSFLQEDRVRIRSCVASADTGEKLNGCIHVVRDACLGPQSDEARSTSLALRMCAWRGIAAWEDEMSVTIAKLDSTLDSPGRTRLVISQRAWKTSMLADVGLRSGIYSGGSLEGVTAAETRADETASREVFLEEIVQSLD